MPSGPISIISDGVVLMMIDGSSLVVMDWEAFGVGST